MPSSLFESDSRDDIAVVQHTYDVDSAFSDEPYSSFQYPAVFLCTLNGLAPGTRPSARVYTGSSECLDCRFH